MTELSGKRNRKLPWQRGRGRRTGDVAGRVHRASIPIGGWQKHASGL
jgi:hypothetical protein